MKPYDWRTNCIGSTVCVSFLPTTSAALGGKRNIQPSGAASDFHLEAARFEFLHGFPQSLQVVLHLKLGHECFFKFILLFLVR
jgi:hypothetical protein